MQLKGGNESLSPWPSSKKGSKSGAKVEVSVSFDSSNSQPVKNRHGDTNTLLALIYKDEVLVSSQKEQVPSISETLPENSRKEKPSLVSSLLQSYSGRISKGEAVEPPQKKQASANPFKRK
jgi:hypothetical protein